MMKLLLAIQVTTILSYSQYNYEVQRAHHIVMDGSIEEWEAIPYTDEFVFHDTGRPPNQGTRVKVAWDDSHLYLAYVADDSEVISTEGGQDSPLYNTDDIFEFFIDPDGDGLNYLEVGVNSMGVYYDYIIKCNGEGCGGWEDDKDFDLPGLQTSGGSLNTHQGYVMEVKIPFSAMNLIRDGGFDTPVSGDIWRINFFRVDKSLSGTDFLSWNPHGSFGFHQPSQFGLMTFRESASLSLDSSSSSDRTNLHTASPEADGQIQVSQEALSLNFSAEVNLVRLLTLSGEVIQSASKTSNFEINFVNVGVYILQYEFQSKTYSQGLLIQ